MAARQREYTPLRLDIHRWFVQSLNILTCISDQDSLSSPRSFRYIQLRWDPEKVLKNNELPADTTSMSYKFKRAVSIRRATCVHLQNTVTY